MIKDCQSITIVLCVYLGTDIHPAYRMVNHRLPLSSSSGLPVVSENALKTCSHFFINRSPSAAHLPPRCYLPPKQCLSFPTLSTLITIHHHFIYFLQEKRRKVQSADFGPAIVVAVAAYDTPTHVSPLLKQASFHLPEAESRGTVKSQHQNRSTPANLTCSDRPRSSCPH